MAASDKDTIYIDIDDEITGIIDKVRNSNGKVVALVLPKRAGVFQSIVNMKLLKRSAEASKKNLVLITSEAGLLPLAGAAGVHVAKTLTSKPEIPMEPQAFDDSEETIDEDDEALNEAVDPTKTVGQLAGAGAVAGGADEVETLVMDDEDVPPEELAAGTPGPKKFDAPKKKDKKLKVPNFERFRLWLILGFLALILLIVGFVFLNGSLAKATITIKTDATNVNATADATLATAATKPTGDTVPAKLASQQKTYTQQVPTTGQKNNGNKANGSVTVTNCSDSDVTLPAGTGFSSGGNTYISQTSLKVPGSDFTSPGSGGKCKNNGKGTVEVLAQSGGAAYNLPSGATFTIAGNPANLSAQGGTFSGGTDAIVQTVNQNDINGAKSKITAATDDTMKGVLKSQLQQGQYYAIDATFQAGTPAITNSAQVGEVANNVTVTETITYTMFGVHKADLQALIDKNIKTQIDTDKQSILDDGLDKAIFTVNDISATGGTVNITTKATAGPDLNTNTIKQNAMGKRAGEIKSDLGSNPDVTSVDVKLSPFWVSTVPKKADKITVNIAKPTTTKASSQSDSKP